MENRIQNTFSRLFGRYLLGDPYIWLVVVGLAFGGILAVYSSTGTLAYSKMGGDTEFYLLRHSVLVIIGFACMWVAHRIDYRYYARLSRLALLLSVPLLLYTYFRGTNLNDASRWLTIPFIDKAFQPSDLAKLALISSLAAMLSKRQGNIQDLRQGLIPMLVWCGLICGLIALSNFSTAIMLFATCMLLLFIGRVPIRYLLGLVLVGIIAGAIAFQFGQRGGTLMSRLNNYTAMVTRGENIPFQAEQSFIAVANGGLMGQGPGNSHQKDFLPHPYSDFIYAIIIEEYGLFGGVVVLMLYLTLLYRGVLAASQSKDAFGGLLSAGLSFSLTLQALIHIGVCTGLFPVTGQTLPLISMGGTSLLFTGLSFGIIISVSRGETDAQLGISKQYGNKRKA